MFSGRTNRRATGRNALACLQATLDRTITQARRSIMAQAGMADMQRLAPRLLTDIGLSRGDIERAACGRLPGQRPRFRL